MSLKTGLIFFKEKSCGFGGEMRQVLWDSRMSGDPKTLCIKTERRRHSFPFYVINTKRYKRKLNLNTCSKKERKESVPTAELDLVLNAKAHGSVCVLYNSTL